MEVKVGGEEGAFLAGAGGLTVIARRERNDATSDMIAEEDRAVRRRPPVQSSAAVTLRA